MPWFTPSLAGRSESQHAGIAQQLSGRALRLLVSDDGRGIPGEILHHGRREGHFGLIGMRERAERLKASLQISSEEGQGTRVLLTVPAKFCVT
jgi:signal transduction histidine kinase